MSSTSLSLRKSALYFGISEIAALLERCQFAFIEQMNVLALIHDLHGEAVFIQRDAFDLLCRLRSRP